jgi:hypothetical protein
MNMPKTERVKKEERPHRDEMNLIEYPIGIVGERVAIDKETKRERHELIFERKSSHRNQLEKEQRWIVRGDPNYGGLPRGYDIDVFNALMTVWSQSDFEHLLVSLGTAYKVLKVTGKDVTQTKSYRRFYQAVDRIFGVSFVAINTVYDPQRKAHSEETKWRILDRVTARKGDGDLPRGYVQFAQSFQQMVRKGFLKITDMERYWRLPNTQTRRLFQYPDKNRTHALREENGKFEINSYLLMIKLGNFPDTVKAYRPARVHDLMQPWLDALKHDGYLLDYRWKREGKGPSAIRLEVTYVADNAKLTDLPLSEREALAVDEIGRLLDEPANRSYHAFVVRELGPDRARRLAGEVMAQAERRPRHTHKGKLFSYLARQERERSSRAHAA